MSAVTAGQQQSEAATPRRKRLVSVSTDAYVGTIDVDVEIDLAEIDTEDLVAELCERDVGGQHVVESALEAIYWAMARGQQAHALRLMRDYIQDLTGRVLP